MITKKHLYLPLLSIILFAACKKSNVNQNKQVTMPKSDTNVYIAGSTISSDGYVQATYWRNGIPIILQSNTPGRHTPSTAGNTSENGFIATVWKNGVESLLPSIDPFSDANGIFVSGNDVYVCGDSYDSPYEPTYHALLWKNGVAVDLEYSTGSIANGVFVSGNDVYVAGSISSPLGTSAAYWKNGKAVVLNANNILAASGNAILVDGSDVYVAGSAFYGSGTTVGKPYIATYWKNGNATMLGDTTGYSDAQSIAVDKGEVYAVGILTIANQNGPIYWKNGTVAQSNTGYSSFSAIAFDKNDDLYFLGQSGEFGYYTKNGKNVKLAGNGNIGSLVYDIALSPY
jgi:ribonucleotide monophosphatase NagD (HAD superfamily)